MRLHHAGIPARLLQLLKCFLTCLRPFGIFQTDPIGFGCIILQLQGIQIFDCSLDFDLDFPDIAEQLYAGFQVIDRFFLRLLLLLQFIQLVFQLRLFLIRQYADILQHIQRSFMSFIGFRI